MRVKNEWFKKTETLTKGYVQKMLKETDEKICYERSLYITSLYNHCF